MVKKARRKLKDYLVLNRYLLSFFNFKNFNDVRDALHSVPEGVNENNKFHFTEELQKNCISSRLRLDLEIYDDNIQFYLKSINQKREQPIQLKYFQYMIILLTEIYLDNYFNRFDEFYDNFVKFINNLNEIEQKAGCYIYPKPIKEEMHKLAVWAATGSGKTIIMHINILQIKKYYKGRYDNFLLITPNEGLSKQHVKELNLSNLRNEIFNQSNYLYSYGNDVPIQIIEITKFREEKDTPKKEGKTVPIEAFGNKNIIFVDEGHKGQASDSSNVWIGHRKDLVSKGGFTFEYSATFGEITDNEDVFNEYAFSIVFAYTYKNFYEDGYGKDYTIFNLRNPEDYGDSYLAFSLLSFYEQFLYYNSYYDEISPFNLSKPLMVYVGTYVSGSGKKENNSDIEKVCKFIADFVNKPEYYTSIIGDLIKDKSPLVNSSDVPITASKLKFLKNFVRKNLISDSKLYNSILHDIFYTNPSSKLEFIELTNADGEIGLRFGSNYFGLINIGDTNSFIKIIKKDMKNGYELFKIGPKSEFHESFFQSIDDNNSSINFLIGSKKFIEGWNSYRVSTMCLLNIGKKKGSLVIQLFGRGIRLKGYKGLLKRSSFLFSDREFLSDNINLDELKVPEQISILETLNVFGIKAQYMEIFNKNLKENDIVNFEKYDFKIKLNIMPSLENKLYLPDFEKTPSEFKEEVFIIGFNKEIPKITIDLSSKIDNFDTVRDSKKFNMINSIENEDEKIAKKRTKTNNNKKIKRNILSPEICSLIDIDRVYLELLQHKTLREYYNIYFTIKDVEKVLKNPSGKYYEFICNPQLLTISQSDDITKLYRIEDFVIQMFKKYLDTLFLNEKLLWQKKHLIYRPIEELVDKIIPRKYIFRVNVNQNDNAKNKISHKKYNNKKEQLNKSNNIGVREFILKLNEFFDDYITGSNLTGFTSNKSNLTDLDPITFKEKVSYRKIFNFNYKDHVKIDFIYFSQHLFHPLIYKHKLTQDAKINDIQIDPFNLSLEDYKFINILQDYYKKVEKTRKIDFYLLKISPHKPLQFLKDIPFTPRFILWYMSNRNGRNVQIINFIDTNISLKKQSIDNIINIWKKIKEIEKTLEDKNKKLISKLNLDFKLNSIIFINDSQLKHYISNSEIDDFDHSILNNKDFDIKQNGKKEENLEIIKNKMISILKENYVFVLNDKYFDINDMIGLIDGM